MLLRNIFDVSYLCDTGVSVSKHDHVSNLVVTLVKTNTVTYLTELWRQLVNIRPYPSCYTDAMTRIIRVSTRNWKPSQFSACRLCRGPMRPIQHSLRGRRRLYVSSIHIYAPFPPPLRFCTGATGSQFFWLLRLTYTARLFWRSTTPTLHKHPMKLGLLKKHF